jgi:histidyl-tRNA synthetase
MIKAVRGTRDLLPPETALWNFVEAAVRDVFRAYNFHEIRTPIFEETQLFARAVGEETDVVSKEMFTWEDGLKAADYAVYKKWLTEKFPAVQSFKEIDPGTATPVSPLPTWYQEGQDYVVFSYRLTPEAMNELKKATTLNGSVLRFKNLRLVTAQSVSKSVNFGAEDLTVIWESIAVDARPQWQTLRPENTAGVVRAYIEHKLWDRGLNKLYYIGPQFRRERPQKGRYRQFYQIGAEIIGPPSSGSERPLRDAEVLEMLATLLDRLGVKDWNLQLNSVGTSADRVLFNEVLRKALEPVAGTMCSDCQRRAVTNPLRVFDCKVPEDQPIIEKLPRIGDYIDDKSREHFANVQALLHKAGVPFEINHRLVRGLDYYTRTTFEFTHAALGAQNAILGGGRYDGLSESLGGPAAPGIGFAMGEDRLILALQELLPSLLKNPDVYVAPVGEYMNREALALARDLRRHDLVVELGDRSFKLKKQFELATKAGARFILIVGENEVKAGAFALKNLESGEQVSVPRAELAQKIQSGS